MSSLENHAVHDLVSEEPIWYVDPVIKAVRISFTIISQLARVGNDGATASCPASNGGSLMRLTFGKLTAAASVAVVTALTWSGSAQAAP